MSKNRCICCGWRVLAEMPAPEPTPEERLAQQEQEIADLKEALEALLSGVTDDA